ncbi:MAG: hypothetical protein MSG64_16655 [Pyrinomonadaceae bacterium MAG19_C2-C3]|nr:hypothetical protein [Pyrinomonadaceae bacterium MAG19_C2-C3]
MSVVTVGVEIDPNREVENRVRKINDEIQNIGGKSKPAGTDALVRSLEAAQSRTLSLQQSFTRLASQSPLSRASQDAGKAANEAQRLQQRLIAIYQTREGKPLASLEREIDVTDRKLSALQQKMFRLQSGATGALGRGGTGGELGSGIASGLGIPIGAAAIGAAGAAGLLYGSKQALDAGAAAEAANRSLAASAKEAGLSYAGLNRESKAFGELMGINKREADRTVAALTDLARIAGRTGDLDTIQRRFADLAAAKGIDPSQISTIARQVIAGEDEGINRLGLPNPGVIYEAYAKAIGTTSDKLTQQQQVVSILDAVMKKSALFSGEAERRLQSGAGQMELLRTRFNNFVDDIGKSALRDLNPLFKFLNGTQSETEGEASARRTRVAQNDVQARLDAGREANARSLAQSRTLISGQSLPSTGVGFDRLQELSRLTDASRQASLAYTSLGEAQRKGVDEYVSAQRGAEADAARRREAEAQKQVQAAQKLQQELGAIQKSGESFIDKQVQRAGAENPFVRIFNDATTAGERLQKQFGKLGNETVAELTRIERAALAAEGLTARFDSQLKALQGRQQADALRVDRSSFELTGAEERKLSIIRAQVEAYREIPTLLAKADAIGRGAFDKNGLKLSAGNIAISQYENLIGLQRQTQGIGGAAGALTRETVNAQLRSLYSSLPVEQQRIISQGATPYARDAKDTFANSFSGGAQFQQNQIQREIERAKVGDLAGRNAQTQLDLIERVRSQGLAGGADPKQTIASADKQVLAITGALDPRELTGSLRTGRIQALEREAAREAAKEAEGKRINRQLLGDGKLEAGLLQKLNRLLTDKGLVIAADGVAFTVNFVDGENSAASSLPAQPTMGLISDGSGLSNR